MKVAHTRAGSVDTQRLCAGLALAVMISLSACEDGPLDAPWCSLAPPPDVASPIAAPTYTEHVAPLLARKCTRCHVDEGIAPFPLTTYADVRTQLDEVRDAVVTHTMPPFLADDCCRPYLYDPSLTDAEIATFTKWIEDGSPEGPPLTPAPVPPEGGLSRTDLVLAMPEPYTPEPRPGEQDVVRCFLLDWPRADRSFVTGFDPMPGNRSVVHHLIVAAVEPDAVPRYEAADRADPGPGFECAGAFGSLGGYHLLGGSLLGSDFPDGVGREVAPGSKIVLNIHYAIPEFGPPPEPDLTRVALRLDPVARPLETMAFLNPLWIVKGAMVVEAGDSDAVYWFRSSPRVLTGGRRVQLVSASPHMHYFGSRFALRVIRKSGEIECLTEIGDWDFGWEQPFWFRDPVVLEPDDELYVECHFDNSAANQPVPGATPRDIGWGDANQDMCVVFVSFVALE